MKQRLKVLGLLCALFAASAWAQDDGAEPPDDGDTGAADVAHGLSGRPWYISGMFSYTDSDSDRGTDGGLGGILSVGKKVTWGLTLELTGFYSAMDAKSGGGTAKLNGYGASALFFPSKTLPNAYGIVSLMQGRTSDLPGPRGSYDSTVFDVGLGYLQPLTTHLLLRLEARYRTDDKGSEPTGPKGKDSNFAEGVYNIGLLVPFGGGEAVKPGTPEDEAAAVVDTSSSDDDNDGISNDLDQCPGSPAGAVDEQGCPIGGDAGAGAGTDTAGAPPADCRTPNAGEQVDENGCAVEAAPAETGSEPAASGETPPAQ